MLRITEGPVCATNCSTRFEDCSSVIDGALSARNSPRQTIHQSGRFNRRSRSWYIGSRRRSSSIGIWLLPIAMLNDATVPPGSPRLRKVDIQAIGGPRRCERITNVTSLARFGKNAGSSRAYDCYLCPQILSLPALTQCREGMSMIARG